MIWRSGKVKSNFSYQFEQNKLMKILKSSEIEKPKFVIELRWEKM